MREPQKIRGCVPPRAGIMNHSVRGLHRNGYRGALRGKATICGDGNYAIRAKPMLVAVRRGGVLRGTQAPLTRNQRGCGGRHRRREAFDAAGQAGPGVPDQLFL